MLQLKDMEQEPLFTLNTKEFIFTETSSDFIWGVVLSTGGLIALSYYLSNFFFIPVLVCIGVLLIVFAHQEPKEINLEIYETGILYAHKEYLWSDFISFWIDTDNEENTRLFLRKKRHQFDELEIFHLLEAVNTDELKEVLFSFGLQEEPLEESLFQQILTRFGY